MVGAWRDQPLQHVANITLWRRHRLFAVVTKHGLLAYITTDGRWDGPICILTILQSILSVFLPHIPGAAANKSCKSELQPNFTQLLANFANLTQALLSHLACAIQLAHISQLLSGESQLQSSLAQPARSWGHLTLILSSISFMVSDVP